MSKKASAQKSGIEGEVKMDTPEKRKRKARPVLSQRKEALILPPVNERMKNKVII